MNHWEDQFCRNIYRDLCSKKTVWIENFTRSLEIDRCPSALQAHESQRFNVIRIAAFNCPLSGTFKTDSWLQTGRIGTRKSTQIFFGQTFSTLRVMDVRAAPKNAFSCGPRGGEKNFDTSPSGVRVRKTSLREVGTITGDLFRRFWLLTFHGPFASHGSNPYPNRTVQCH